MSLVLIGILSVQFGAAISKGQFDEIPPVGMVLLRLFTSAVILLALARPRLRGRTSSEWRPVLALGLALGAMNWAFYESLARIPLGVAVTIEFIGPLGLAAVGRRGPRDLVWVGLAAMGVLLLVDRIIVIEAGGVAADGPRDQVLAALAAGRIGAGSR